MEINANKVIENLLTQIRKLSYDNAVLSAQVQTLTEDKSTEPVEVDDSQEGVSPF